MAIFSSQTTLHTIKISVLKTLISRAIKISPSYTSLDCEIQCLKQVFTYNNSHSSFIDRVISNAALGENLEAVSSVFVQLSSVSIFKSDGKIIKHLSNQYYCTVVCIIIIYIASNILSWNIIEKKTKTHQIMLYIINI